MISIKGKHILYKADSTDFTNSNSDECDFLRVSKKIALKTKKITVNALQDF